MGQTPGARTPHQERRTERPVSGGHRTKRARHAGGRVDTVQQHSGAGGSENGPCRFLLNPGSAVLNLDGSSRMRPGAWPLGGCCGDWEALQMLAGFVVRAEASNGLWNLESLAEECLPVSWMLLAGWLRAATRRGSRQAGSRLVGPGRTGAFPREPKVCLRS
jgi:hypothetical protein